MSLCLHGKSNRRQINSEAISSVEFFTASATKLKSTGSNTKEMHHGLEVLDSGGEKVEVMQMTYDFIKQWEPSILVILPSVRMHINCVIDFCIS